MDFQLNEVQQMWQETVHEFIKREVKPKAQHVDETGEFNWQAVYKMAPLGLLGLNASEEYGGAGIDSLSAAIAIEELGWGCGSTALAIAAHNGLGCASLALFGDKDLKEKYLKPAASGHYLNGAHSKLAALALTEPGAGSDLRGGVITKAILVDDHWVINGSKMWCTNAGIADFIVVLVRTEQVTKERPLSLILIPTDLPGVIISPPEKKMGLKGSPTHAVTFDHVKVPTNHLLGKPGDGLRQTLTVLDGGRIGIGALSIGLAQAAFEEAVTYAKERHSFGVPLAAHQAIQWMMADAATEIHAARLMIYQAAWLKNKGLPYSKSASMAKLFATEMAERVCRNAIQVLGGYGYSREFPVERIYRDARLMTIGEGSSEMQRLVIARHIF